MNRVPEPCLCGDPECKYCFPGREREPRLEQDPDYLYEEWRDRQFDSNIAPIEPEEQA